MANVKFKAYDSVSFAHNHKLRYRDGRMMRFVVKIKYWGLEFINNIKLVLGQAMCHRPEQVVVKRRDV